MTDSLDLGGTGERSDVAEGERRRRHTLPSQPASAGVAAEPALSHKHPDAVACAFFRRTACQAVLRKKALQPCRGAWLGGGDAKTGGAVEFPISRRHRECAWRRPRNPESLTCHRLPSSSGRRRPPVFWRKAAKRRL